MCRLSFIVEMFVYAHQGWALVEGVCGFFHLVKTTIEGEMVVLEVSDIPKRVRYAWANNPEVANFINLKGLQASPFENVIQ